MLDLGDVIKTIYINYSSLFTYKLDLIVQVV